MTSQDDTTYNQYPLLETCSAKVESLLSNCLGSDLSPPAPTNIPERKKK